MLCIHLRYYIPYMCLVYSMCTVFVLRVSTIFIMVRNRSMKQSSKNYIVVSICYLIQFNLKGVV